MAVQASGVATLLDVLQTMAPDGKQMDIGEVLTQQNEVLDDMVWREGNTITGHRDAVRTSLPTPSFRAINEGVPVTKSGSTPIEETAALLEGGLGHRSAEVGQVLRAQGQLGGGVSVADFST